MNPEFTPFPFLTDIFPTLLQWAFGFGLFLFIIYSLFLFYHWFAYGSNRRTNVLAVIFYAAATLPLLIIMGTHIPNI